jgi:hypothetical protein
MSDTKHTPGPWYHDSDCETHAPVIHFGVGNGGFSLHPDTPNADANAILIAAAPDLLEALRQISGMTAPGSPYSLNRLRSIANEAIRKATGGAE